MNAVLNFNSAEKWMQDDLTKSGLEPVDLGASAFNGVGITPWPKIELLIDGKKTEQDLSAWISSYYQFPYFDPDGELVPNFVVRKPRFKNGAPAEATEKKYVRPSKAVLGSMAAIPYMHPGRREQTAGILDIHEGEKKTACAVRHGQWAIGIGGCHSWGDPENKGQLHPWIKKEVARIQALCPDQRIKVRIWPDADFRTNPSVGPAFSALAAELTALDVDVVLMDLSGFDSRAKFDDMVVEKGYERVMAAAVECPPSDLPESPEALVRKYQLLSQPVGKTEKHVPQPILDNYIVLLERHPHFRDETGKPLIWLNMDQQRPMMGESEMVENLTDTNIVRYFQRHLGFNGVGRTAQPQSIRDAIANRLQANRRSPFADRVRAAAERLSDAGPDAMKDADELLDTWALRYLHAPDTEFNRRWGRKFLMSIVGRALRPGCFMRTAYVIAGPQDIGKSAFMEAMLGKHHVKIINENNSKGKDLAMTYASCLVAVHDEMQAMTSRGLQSVKSDISATVDSIRPPYSRLNVDMPRRCVFLIPVDRMDFLFEDSAGMTRFAVLNLLESHRKGDRFDFAGMEAAADVLLGAAWLAVESGEVFDVVEGAAESAMAHIKIDLNMEQIRDVIEGGLLRLESGTYKGREITGFKLTDLASAMPGQKSVGGASAVLTGPLFKFGFEHEDRNKEPLGVRGLWFMDTAKFDQQFKVKARKF